MDFSFTEEQNMLQESVERFVQSDYSFDDRQKMRARIWAMTQTTGTPLLNWDGWACPSAKLMVVLAAVRSNQR